VKRQFAGHVSTKKTLERTGTNYKQDEERWVSSNVKRTQAEAKRGKRVV